MFWCLQLLSQQMALWKALEIFFCFFFWLCSEQILHLIMLLLWVMVKFKQHATCKPCHSIFTAKPLSCLEWTHIKLHNAANIIFWKESYVSIKTTWLLLMIIQQFYWMNELWTHSAPCANEWKSWSLAARLYESALWPQWKPQTSALFLCTLTDSVPLWVWPRVDLWPD